MAHNKWIKYDRCQWCGAPPMTACLNMTMPGSTRTKKTPHPRRARRAK